MQPLLGPPPSTTPSSPRPWSITRGGPLLALVSVGFVFFAWHVSLEHWLTDTSPLLAFILPVVLSAALGGLWVGLLATLLAAPAAAYLLPPAHSLTVHLPADRFRLVLFVVTCVFICLFSERMRREVERSRAVQRMLEERDRQSAQSASYFHALIESRTLGVAEYRGNGEMVGLNDAFLAMLGLSKEDFAIRGGTLRWKELTPPEFWAADAQAIEQLRATGVCTPFEKEFIKTDGTRARVLVGGAVVLDRSNDISGMVYVVDLSRLRTVEAALRESEARLRLALDAAQAGTWDWDIAKNELVWSELNYRLLGLDPAVTTPVSIEAWLDRLHEEDRPRARAEIHRVLSPGSGDEYRTELRVVHPSRGVRWLFSVGQVQRGPRGEAVRLLGINLDITERRRIEDSERAARAEAERASRLKDEFVATLSHELRTPLTAVLGWAQVLRRPDVQADKLGRGLEVIERNARLLSQLVSDLLDVSRIVTGKIRLDLVPVDLGAVVRAAAETTRPAAEAKGVRLDIDIAPIGEPVLADPARIEQIVWNLLSNAIKFTPPGGAVGLSVRATAGHVDLVVRDTGEGIAKEFLPHLFERFRQEDASSSRKHGGLGLGLAIVKHIAELHGGRVRADSPGPGLGARFTVELPLSTMPLPRAAAEHAPPPLEASPELGGVRVLVVEDEPDTRELVRRVLEESRAEVVSASSAAEALDAFDAVRPDVLVSDIGMPGMDGYALLRAIRGREGARARLMPALALTAFARSDDRKRALAAGYSEHMPKPVDPAELVAAVARLFRSASASGLVNA